MNVRVLEEHAEWHAGDVADPAQYTEVFSADELDQLDRALAHVRPRADDMLSIGKGDFPLGSLAQRLKRVEHELINGRGIVVLRGVDRDRYDNDEMCLLYWGIGMHLGRPWAQNHKGHLLGDVSDQGKGLSDPTARGNELGTVGLPYHSDGSDLVGLMCLQTGAEGGESMVCNALAIHNDMVRQSPELAEALYEPQPYDFRGEQRKGGKPFYTMPVFSEWNGRLFIRYIRPYILASQRHPEAPRIGATAEQAMQRLDAMTEDPIYQVEMAFAPGDMQFINNYHVLHGRKPYQDDPEGGRVRHLKRLWLETEVLAARPPHFQNNSRTHWSDKASISRLDRTTATRPS
ncbi:MAG: TauD/TfdA family dioxygenase [Myxococcales bacterium]|nr:TauD/TfdA family dioxygenase [Myxococcales bacterium]